MSNIIPYDYVAIGKRVIDTIQEKGYTMYSFAPIIGMVRQTLSDKCKGKSSFNLNELVQIANNLDVSISYLLCEDDYTNKEKEVIGKYLKLREDTIDRIANYNDVEISMFNSLVCYSHNKDSKDNLRPLLNAIYEYKMMSCSDSSSIEINDPVFNMSNKYTEKSKKEGYLKYNVISVLEKCLDDDYWIIDYVHGLAKELYLYKHHPNKSQIKKAEKDLKQELQKNSKKPKKKGSI